MKFFCVLLVVIAFTQTAHSVVIGTSCDNRLQCCPSSQTMEECLGGGGENGCFHDNSRSACAPPPVPGAGDCSGGLCTLNPIETACSGANFTEVCYRAVGADLTKVWQESVAHSGPNCTRDCFDPLSNETTVFCGVFPPFSCLFKLGLNDTCWPETPYQCYARPENFGASEQPLVRYKIDCVDDGDEFRCKESPPNVDNCSHPCPTTDMSSTGPYLDCAFCNSNSLLELRTCLAIDVAACVDATPFNSSGIPANETYYFSSGENTSFAESAELLDTCCPLPFCSAFCGRSLGRDEVINCILYILHLFEELSCFGSETLFLAPVTPSPTQSPSSSPTMAPTRSPSTTLLPTGSPTPSPTLCDCVNVTLPTVALCTCRVAYLEADPACSYLESGHVCACFVRGGYLPGPDNGAGAHICPLNGSQTIGTPCRCPAAYLPQSSDCCAGGTSNGFDTTCYGSDLQETVEYCVIGCGDTACDDDGPREFTVMPKSPTPAPGTWNSVSFLGWADGNGTCPTALDFNDPSAMGYIRPCIRVKVPEINDGCECRIGEILSGCRFASTGPVCICSHRGGGETGTSDDAQGAFHICPLVNGTFGAGCSCPAEYDIPNCCESYHEACNEVRNASEIMHFCDFFCGESDCALATPPINWNVLKVGEQTFDEPWGKYNFLGYAYEDGPSGCSSDFPHTISPYGDPFCAPTSSPTLAPSSSPTEAPSRLPTASPTKAPSQSPSNAPSRSPTSSPSALPTASPITVPPTLTPTSSPTDRPVRSPPTPFPTPSMDSIQGETPEIDDNVWIVVGAVLCLLCSVFFFILALIWLKKSQKKSHDEEPLSPRSPRSPRSARSPPRSPRAPRSRNVNRRSGAARAPRSPRKYADVGEARREKEREISMRETSRSAENPNTLAPPVPAYLQSPSATIYGTHLSEASEFRRPGDLPGTLGSDKMSLYSNSDRGQPRESRVPSEPYNAMPALPSALPLPPASAKPVEASGHYNAMPASRMSREAAASEYNPIPSAAPPSSGGMPPTENEPTAYMPLPSGGPPNPKLPAAPFHKDALYSTVVVPEAPVQNAYDTVDDMEIELPMLPQFSADPGDRKSRALRIEKASSWRPSQDSSKLREYEEKLAKENK